MTDFWTTMSQHWNETFWSSWVMVIVVINYGTILFLFLWAPWVKIPTEEDGTTGHAWSDGEVREGLAKLPKWWLIISSGMFIFAFVYVVLYPSFGSHKGVKGWTSFEQMQEQLAVTDSQSHELWERIRTTSVLDLSKDEQAMRLGTRLFDDNCAACHGYDAKGNTIVGAPNLTDNTWQFGGKVSDVVHTITKGRVGSMPPWESALGYGKVKNVANYILGLSGASHDAGAAKVGKKVYDSTCVACHGADATGNQMLGAPNLTDNIWKWGGSHDEVIHTIAKGRNGHMPAWEGRLNKDEIHLLAAWVLSHDNTEEAIAANDK